MAPLLAALVVAALNPRPAVSLRLLTWQTPAQPLGAWIAALSLGGAALSGGATALALRDSSPALRRRLRRDPRDGRDSLDWTQQDEIASRGDGAGGGWSQEVVFGRRGAPGPFGAGADRDRRGAAEADPGFGADSGWSGAATAGPSRAPGEPAPTVSVPYRVIRRADGASAHGGGGAVAAGERQPGRPEPEPMPVADDWQQSGVEDW